MFSRLNFVNLATGAGDIRIGSERAIGKVVRRGQTIGLTECDVTDEQNNLVARASSTCMVLRGENANGR